MFTSFAYRHSPIWAQELLTSAQSSLRNAMREGRAFETVAAQVHESQWWSEQELRDFQARKLRTILESAARDVPYYRNKYRPLGLDFEEMELPEAVASLPLITKADVRKGGKSDRKSTRLNSSHVEISYAVFCLKKKKT